MRLRRIKRAGSLRDHIHHLHGVIKMGGGIICYGLGGLIPARLLVDHAGSDGGLAVRQTRLRTVIARAAANRRGQRPRLQIHESPSNGHL